MSFDIYKRSTANFTKHYKFHQLVFPLSAYQLFAIFYQTEPIFNKRKTSSN